MLYCLRQMGQTALWVASANGYDDIVQLLLADFRTDVNFPNLVRARYVMVYSGWRAS